MAQIFEFVHEILTLEPNLDFLDIIDCLSTCVPNIPKYVPGMYIKKTYTNEIRVKPL